MSETIRFVTMDCLLVNQWSVRRLIIVHLPV